MATPQPEQFQPITFTQCPTIQQFEQVIYLSYQLGDQQSTHWLQSFQRSQYAWHGVNLLFGLQQPSLPNLELPIIHHCASYIALDKIRSEWKTMRAASPDKTELESVKAMLLGHFSTIINNIQSGFYARSLALSHTILSNLAEGLSTIAVLDNTCQQLYDSIINLSSTSPAIALILLTALADVNKTTGNGKVHLSKTVEDLYDKFLKKQFPAVLALCEDFLTPLAVLFNRDINPASFTPISACIVGTTPLGQPIQSIEQLGPDYINCSTLTFSPFYSPDSTQQGTYIIDKFRGLQSLTPLVPIRTYLQLPRAIPTNQMVASSDLLFAYRYYPIHQQAALAASSNIITLTLRCIAAWIPNFTAFSNFITSGHGLMLHFLLALLPFDLYTTLVLNILSTALQRRSHPLPAHHKHCVIFLSKVLVEYSISIQSRMLYAWVVDHINKDDSNQQKQNSPILATTTTTTYMNPQTNTIVFSSKQHHLLALLHKQQQSHNAQVSTACDQVNLQFVTSPDQYNDIIATNHNHPLTQQYHTFSYFFQTYATNNGNNTTTNTSHYNIFEQHVDLITILRHFRIFVTLVSDLVECESTIFINGPKPIISLTNFIILTLAHPQLSHSLNALDFFVAVQDVLFADRGYLFQQPLFVIFFVITSLQLAQPGLALLWLTKNPDTFDAIGVMGSNKYSDESEEISNFRDISIKNSHVLQNAVPIHDFCATPYHGENNYQQIQSQCEQANKYILMYNSNHTPQQPSITAHLLKEQPSTLVQSTLPMITQQIISSFSTQELQNTLITNLNFTPHDYFDIDCATFTLFTTDFFLNIAYDDYCDDLEQNRLRFIDKIRGTMFDLYKIFDVSIITFFFRTLGLHLPVSTFMSAQSQLQLQTMSNKLSSLQFLTPFISPSNTSPIPPMSLLPSVIPDHISTAPYPSTGLLTNDGSSLDSLELLTFPKNALTGQPVSLLELYAYIQHVPLTPTLQQVQLFSQQQQQQQQQQPSLQIEGYIPYILPQNFDYNIYIAFTHSVFQLLTALSSSCSEGFSDITPALERALNCPDLDGAMDAPAGTTLQYVADVLRKNIAPQIHKIHSITTLFYKLISTLSQLPSLPSFTNHPKHSQYNQLYLKYARQGQNQQSPQEIDQDIALISSYNSSRTTTRSLKVLPYVQPLAFPILSLFASYNYIFPTLHPTTITYTLFFINQCISRGSQQLIQFLNLCHANDTTTSTQSLSYTPFTHPTLVTTNDRGIISEYSLDAFICNQIEKLGHPSHDGLLEPTLAVLLMSLRDLELSPTQAIDLTPSNPSTAESISILSTPPPIFNFASSTGQTIIPGVTDMDLLCSDYHPSQLALLSSLALLRVANSLSLDKTIIFGHLTSGSTLIENQTQQTRLRLVQETLHNVGLYITPTESHFTYSLLPSTFATPNASLLYLLNVDMVSPQLSTLIANNNAVIDNNNSKNFYFDLSSHVPLLPLVFTTSIQHYSTKQFTPIVSMNGVPHQLHQQQLQTALKLCSLPNLLLPSSVAILCKVLRQFVSTFPSTLSHLITTSLLTAPLSSFSSLTQHWLNYFTRKIGQFTNTPTNALANLETIDLNILSEAINKDRSFQLVNYIIISLLQSRLDGFKALLFLTKPLSEHNALATTTSSCYFYGSFHESASGIRETATQLISTLLPTISTLFSLVPIFNQIQVISQPEILASHQLLLPLLQFTVGTLLSPPTLPLHRFQLIQRNFLQSTPSDDIRAKHLGALLHSDIFYHQFFMLTQIPLKTSATSSSVNSATSCTPAFLQTISQLITNAIDICPQAVSQSVPALLNSLSRLVSQFPPQITWTLFQQYSTITPQTQHQFGLHIASIQSKIEQLWVNVTSLLGMLGAAVKEYHSQLQTQSYFIGTLESVLNCVVDTIFLHSFINELTINIAQSSTPRQQLPTTPPSMLSLPLNNSVFQDSVLTAAPLLRETFLVLTSLLAIKTLPTANIIRSLNEFLGAQSSPSITNGQPAISSTSQSNLPLDYILHNKFAINVLLDDQRLYSFPLLLTTSSSLVKNIIILITMTSFHCTKSSSHSPPLREGFQVLIDLLNSSLNMQQFVTFFQTYITQSMQYDPWFPNAIQALTNNSIQSPSQFLLQHIFTSSSANLPNALTSQPVSASNNVSGPNDVNPDPISQFHNNAVAQLRIIGLFVLATVNQYPALSNPQSQQPKTPVPRQQLEQLLTTYHVNPNLVPFITSLLQLITIVPHQIILGKTLPSQPDHYPQWYSDEKNHNNDPHLPLQLWLFSPSNNNNNNTSNSATHPQLFGPSPLQQYICSLGQSIPAHMYNFYTLGTAFAIASPSSTTNNTPITTIQASLLHYLGTVLSVQIRDSPTHQRVAQVMWTILRTIPQQQLMSWLELLLTQNQIVPSHIPPQQRLILSQFIAFIMDQMTTFVFQTLWNWHTTQVTQQQKKLQNNAPPALTIDTLFDPSPTANSSSSKSTTLVNLPQTMSKLRADFNTKSLNQIRKFSTILKEIVEVLQSTSRTTFDHLQDFIE